MARLHTPLRRSAAICGRPEAFSNHSFWSVKCATTMSAFFGRDGRQTSVDQTRDYQVGEGQHQP
jgi:hypothetical protein